MIPAVLPDALNASDVQVVHMEFPHMWHDFQLYAGIVPEATLAIEEIGRFIGGEIAPIGQDRPQPNGIRAAIRTIATRGAMYHVQAGSVGLSSEPHA